MTDAYRALSALFTDAQGGSVLSYVLLAAVCFAVIVLMDRLDRARSRRLGDVFPPSADADEAPTRSRPIIHLWPEDAAPPPRNRRTT